MQIIKPYVDEAHSHQEAESLRAASLSKLDKTWSTAIQFSKQNVLNSPENDRYTCTYSHSRNLHQKFVSLFHLPNCSREHLYNSHIPFFYN